MLAKSRQNYLSEEEKFRAEKVCSELKALSLFTDNEKKMIAVALPIEERTIRAHANDLLKAFEDFPYKSRFTTEETEMLCFCFRHHDDGKVDRRFQEMLRGYPAECEPHGHLSALLLSYAEFKEECPHCNEEEYYICLAAIYNHHTRQSTRSAEEIYQYALENVEQNAIEYFRDRDIKLRKRNITNPFLTKLKTDPAEKNYVGDADEFRREYRRYQKIKGALNYFDYIASSSIDVKELPSDEKARSLVKAINERYPKLRPVQEYMRDNADKNIIVISSTGSGKTEGACLWINGEKALYTLPMKTSSNEIYRRIHDKYGFENARILHSGALDVYLNGGEDDAFETMESASLLTSPFTVCTADQVFKFAYQAPGTERLAAITSFSKVVVDELQSFSPETVAAIIFGLVQIVQMGGRFCIMTATLPNFFIKKLGSELRRIGRSDAMPEVVRFDDNSVRRHMFCIEREFDIPRIIKEGEQKKVLIICNTVAKAIDLLDQLKEAGAWCLHSRFLPEDRALLERNIMRFAISDDKGIWITTQIAEASLDIDFDLLFTEISTGDSFIQRIGRVFRKGDREPSEPNVIVIDNQGWEGVYDEDIIARTRVVLREYEGILITEKDKLSMFDRIFDEEGLKGSKYMRTFRNKYSALLDRLPNSYTLEEANKYFRDIEDNISVIPERIYLEKEAEINTILSALSTRGVSKRCKRMLRSKLRGMTLSVNKRSYKKLLLDEVWEGVWRIAAVYDFDEDAVSGKGLLKETEAEIW